MSGVNLRFINTIILILIGILMITGLYGLVWPFPTLLFEIHRATGWALIILIPWKAIISLRSISRGIDMRPDRNIMILASVLAAIATLIILILGLLWKWNMGEYYLWIAGYGYTAIGWHWGIALYFLLPLFILHVWRRWPRPKKTDFSERRQFLKLIGIGTASIAAWQISETVAKTLESNTTRRRFTGSREEDSFTGNEHPVTSGPEQGKIKLDPEIWRLHLTGAIQIPITLTYPEIIALSTSEVTADLDCTGGWYTTQTWRGVRLTDLLNQAEVSKDAFAIVLKGVFEYKAHFTLSQAQEILLATHVSGEVLNHSHGYPVRAVVPSRRGWHWVKWLTDIEVLNFGL